MTWKEKAEEISATILKGMKDISRDSIASALSQAAIMGMEFDCENWCKQKR